MSTRKQPMLSAEVDQILGPAPAIVARPEVVVLRFRRHGRHLFFPVLVLIAVPAAIGYFFGALPEPWMNPLLVAVGALVFVLLGVLPVLAWLARRTTVTTSRAIVQRGLFVRHRSEVALARVREVRTRQGLWKRMWGAGDIDLHVGAEAVVLQDVAGARVVADALRDLVQRNFAAGPDPALGTQPPDGTGVVL